MKKIAILFISALLSLGVLTGCSTEQKNEESKIPEKPTLMTFNESKSYEESATYESGIITVSDVVLKNATFNGDLTIDKSVGEGDITLDSIKVNGKLIIQGGGSNSIHIDNSDIKSMESSKEGTPVRIVVSENTVVQNAELSGHTNLEVSGQITSLNVNPEAKATDIALQPNSKVEKVEVNAPTSLLVQSPITDLNLKAESKVSLEAAVENVRVETAAQNTTINVAKDVVVANLATETKVEVSGEGKLTTVLTTDTNNVTGNIKAETTTVNENPIQESNKEIVAATPTPVATNAPKPTAVPTKAPATPVPTVEPTPVPPSTPSTPKPTAVPTATPIPLTPWDGTTIDTSWYNETASNFTIYNGAQLAGLRKLVNEGNNFASKVINLGANIDLNMKNWLPIGVRYARAGMTIEGEDAGENYSEFWIYYNTFAGVFDGKDYTINGLYSATDNLATANDGAALFGFVSDATIKNLKFTNFSIQGKSRVAVVAAYALGGSVFENIELSKGDVSVINPTSIYKDCTSWSVGGIVGQMWNYPTYNVSKNNAIYNFKDCTINNDVKISGESNVGGIWGSITEATSKLSTNTIDASSEVDYPYWKGDKTITYSGYDATVIVENCLNAADIYASLVNAGSLAGWAYTASIDIKSFENTGKIFVNNIEQQTPKIISGNTTVTSVPFYFSDKSTTKVVQNSDQLVAALASKAANIEVRGTIGSESEYSIYKINAKTSIKGAEGNKIYGSFIVDADDVEIDGLEIHNEGWVTGNPVDARRNAITIVSNKVSIVNNNLISSAMVSSDSAISNGIVLYAGTDKNTSIKLENNKIVGYGYENDAWSSTGIMFVAGLDFPYNTTNKQGSKKAVNLSVNYSELAKLNMYESSYNDFVYVDYGSNTGNNVYKYSYSSNEYGILDGLYYAHPEKSIIEVATKQEPYTFNRQITHSEKDENRFTIKENSELIIPTSSIVNVADDTELIIAIGGKLTGTFNGVINDLAAPTVSDATIVYSADSQNLLVEFKLNNGYVLNAPELLPEELGAVYTDLLTGDENASKVAASKIGSDLILNYYYINDQNQHVPLMTAGTNGPSIPVMKNKYWDGYLNYYNIDGTTTKLVSGAIANTLLGVEIPNDKTWTTSTNIYTGTVAEGWLDDAKGRTVYVDIIVLYNGKVSKTTVSVSIPANVTNEQVVEENNVTNKDSLEVVEEKQEKVESTEVNESNTDSQDKENVQEEPTLENEEKVDSESIENSEPPVETPSID